MSEIDVKAMVEKFCSNIEWIATYGVEHEMDRLDELEELPGIYFVATKNKNRAYLVDKGQIVYVGTSTNVRAEWQNHHKMSAINRLSEFIKEQKKLTTNDPYLSGHQLFVNPYYLPFTQAHTIKEIEDEFIRQLSPLLNERNSLSVETTIHVAATTSPETTITAEPSQPVEEDTLIFPPPRWKDRNRRAEDSNYWYLDERLISLANGYTIGYWKRPDDGWVNIERIYLCLHVKRYIALEWAKARGLIFPMKTEKFIRIAHKLNRFIEEERKTLEEKRKA